MQWRPVKRSLERALILLVPQFRSRAVAYPVHSQFLEPANSHPSTRQNDGIEGPATEAAHDGKNGSVNGTNNNEKSQCGRSSGERGDCSNSWAALASFQLRAIY